MSIKLALLGRHIQHSRSPQWHNQWLQEAGLQGQYDLWTAEDVPSYDDIAQSGLHGFNVTMPYKKDIFSYCTEKTLDAEQTGVVNTLRLKDGKLSGCNTDARALLEFLEGHTFLNAVILGRGATAKSSHWCLLQMGCELIRLLSREEELTPEMAGKADIIINATPMGAEGQENLEIPDTFNGFFVDWAYRAQGETYAIERCRALNLLTISGPELLEKQARLSFSFWFEA